MVIYHYVEIIWTILATPNFGITYSIMKHYFPGKPVDINIQSLIYIFLNCLNAYGMAPGGFICHHRDVRPGGTQDERGKDSRNDLSAML